jgi:uncharacterized protein DUF4252
MKIRLIPFLFLLPLIALGCAGGAPSVDAVRWEIQRRMPEARFELEEHVRLGRISMGLIHGLVRMAPGDNDGREMINDVHRVEVATYKVISLPDLDRFEGQTGFERDLTRSGWTLAVRTREAGERTWMFLHTDSGGALSNLFVVTLDGKELTLVRLDGRLDRAFAAAVADHPKDVARQVGAGG